GRPNSEQAEIGDDENPRKRGPFAGGDALRDPLPGGVAKAHPARSSPRLIFPLGVFGSSSANSTMRGYLYGAVTRFTCSWSSAAVRSEGSPPARTTIARPPEPRSSSGDATAAASATAGCETSADSTSNGPTR